ncbi:hypothetical protein KAM448_43230 [Aeromonas caviae]|nr:hypothetical protein KAM355_43370 [Aeromonas caviae]GJB00594.1 hypothetical protein KAM359_40010 [Aeromonas caviae]GJB26596.1 hypothetical protein KAM365_43460 [Aeromonas caviae]GJB43552.1 hypothetical protein KAM369_40270 [Aeromonas caviae]GJB46657.1 hypothetical protein KAM370_25990 [Aeromonas caviae]
MQPKRLTGSLNRDTGASPCGITPVLLTGVIKPVLSNGPKKEASRTGRFVVTSVSWQISLTGVN